VGRLQGTVGGGGVPWWAAGAIGGTLEQGSTRVWLITMFHAPPHSGGFGRRRCGVCGACPRGRVAWGASAGWRAGAPPAPQRTLWAAQRPAAARAWLSLIGRAPQRDGSGAGRRAGARGARPRGRAACDASAGWWAGAPRAPQRTLWATRGPIAARAWSVLIVRAPARRQLRAAPLWRAGGGALAG